MTLDEAILHSEQIADSYKDTEPNCKCAKEHRQLTEWLKELKHLRVIEPKQADDLISRADAMAYPISWENYDKRHGNTHFVCGVESYREYIEYLPSAQPTIEERKTGRWIPHDCLGRPSIDKDVCSECKQRFYQIAETGCEWNYCPNCGAKMEVERD